MENILVMHTGGWIGDMILLTPALRALREKFPKSRISMLLLPLVQELMERNPYLDEVIVYDKRNTQKGFWQMQKMANRLRMSKFDMAIILHPNSIRSGWLAWMAGVPKRIGAKVRGGKSFLTVRVHQPYHIHEVRRYLNVVEPIVGKDHRDGLEFWGIGDEDKGFAERSLYSLSSGAGPIIGINVSTTWPSKRWQVERFAELIDLLLRRLDARIVLTGGIDDIPLGNEISTGAGSVLNLIGNTTLWQLGALISRCDLYITPDSGPMHISAALGTPTIALFGPTDPVRHGPYGEGHIAIRKCPQCKPCYKRKCKSKDHLCMRTIYVEDVVEAVESSLKRGRPLSTQGSP